MEKNKDYKKMILDEAKHWDNFEKKFIEKDKIIPWWVDIRNASSDIGSCDKNISPKRESLLRGRFKDMIISACKPEDNILDIGCGSGWLSLELARKGCNVIAIDVSQYRIETANKYYLKVKNLEKFKGTINYIAGDINNIELPNNFDTIVAWDSLHHLPDLDDLLVFLRDKLRKNGKIICFDHLGSKFIENLGKIRKLFVKKEEVSAFEDISQEEILLSIKNLFEIKKIEYKFTAPFRLFLFALTSFDFLDKLIPQLNKIDSFLANTTKIFGREFVYIEAQKNKK